MTQPREVRLSWRMIIALMMFVLVWPAFGTVLAIRANAASEARYRSALAKTEAARVESEQKLCTIIVLLDDASRRAPGPISERGKDLAKAYEQLRTGYHCPPRT